MSRLFGVNAIRDLMGKVPDAIVEILVTDADQDRAVTELIGEAAARGIIVRHVRRSEQRERSGGRGGSRISAEVRPAQPLPLDQLVPDGEGGPLLLIIDGVTDPHNLGAIMRSAAAFDVKAVICGKERQAPMNDAALRASAGAIATVPLIRVTNLSRAVRQLRDQGFWIYASTLDTNETFWDVDLTGPVALVVGAEGTGVRPGLVKACDRTLKLPMSGAIQSLNVSVFTGIVLGEASRQRLKG